MPAARSPFLGFLGPRVDLIPHQLFVAAEAAARGAEVVLVPECFSYLGPENGKIDLAESLDQGGPILERCRKTARDAGKTAHAIAAMIEGTEAELKARDSAAARAMHVTLKAARLALIDVVDFIAGKSKASPNEVFAGSVTYLMLAGNVIAGWQMARSLIAAEKRLAEGVDPEFMRAKIATARFYGDHLLSKAPGLRHSIVEGAAGLQAMPLAAY